MSSDTIALIAQLGGELVTYTPAGGIAKVIRVIVERDRPSHEVQLTNGVGYGVNTRQLLIANDADECMTAIQEHKDHVLFKKNLSDATDTDFIVQRVLKEDKGLAGGGGAFLVLVQS